MNKELVLLYQHPNIKVGDTVDLRNFMGIIVNDIHGEYDTFPNFLRYTDIWSRYPHGCKIKIVDTAVTHRTGMPLFCQDVYIGEIQRNSGKWMTICWTIKHFLQTFYGMLKQPLF